MHADEFTRRAITLCGLDPAEIFAPLTCVNLRGAKDQVAFKFERGDTQEYGFPPLNMFYQVFPCFCAFLVFACVSFVLFLTHARTQPDLEAALRSGLARFPHVTPKFGHRAVAIEQDGNGVTVRVCDAPVCAAFPFSPLSPTSPSDKNRDRDRDISTDKQPTNPDTSACPRCYTIRAKYLVGCDGARSLTRKTAMGSVPLESLRYDMPWLCVDAFEQLQTQTQTLTQGQIQTEAQTQAQTQIRLPHELNQYMRALPGRISTFVPCRYPHFRWEIMLHPGERAQDMETPEVCFAASFSVSVFLLFVFHCVYCSVCVRSLPAARLPST